MYKLPLLSKTLHPLQRSYHLLRPLRKSQRVFRPTVTALFHTSRTNSNDGFLQGSSSNYIESMYEAWLHDPKSVHISWQVYFKNMKNGLPPSQAYTPPPTLMPSDSARLPEMPGGHLSAVSESSKQVIDHMKIQLLVRAYQVRGHHLANLDPLQIQHASIENLNPPELTYQYYGFTDKDLDRKFSLGPGILSALTKTQKELTLREIIAALKKMYCKVYTPSLYIIINF